MSKVGASDSDRCEELMRLILENRSQSVKDEVISFRSSIETFAPGDWVSIGNGHDNPSEGIIIGSYYHLYGCGRRDIFSLHPKEFGEKCSWFHLDELKLIDNNRWDIYQEWEKFNFLQSLKISNNSLF
jgi:hypothetical protein